jgi:hypothetical protein
LWIMSRVELITEIIKRRYSCRTYTGDAIDASKNLSLQTFLSGNRTGPFGTSPRIELHTAGSGDLDALKDLGTYGFIRGASGFIIGTVEDSKYNLEDFGYLLEESILHATRIGLGTCWLGGSFNKSAFSNKISAMAGERVPAVVATGYMAPRKSILESAIRWGASSKHRKSWPALFFKETFKKSILPEEAADYATPLEMIRIAPSASNKQPWRIIIGKGEAVFHFFLERTKNYYKRNKQLFKMADLQRIDMGIAMCHFELACREAGLTGKWEIKAPEIGPTPELTEYLVSWNGSREPLQ